MGMAEVWRPLETASLLKNAYHSASQSPDKSNQNGAVLFCTSNVVGSTYIDRNNNFPDGFVPSDDSREEKLANIEHAERSVIYAAARMGLRPVTMYCPWAACHDCARAIVLSGIQRLVVHRQRMELTPERWAKDVEGALRKLKAAGVGVEWYDGPVPFDGTVFVNGRPWSPRALKFVDEV